MKLLKLILVFLFVYSFLPLYAQQKSTPFIIYSDKVAKFYIEAVKENEIVTGNCKSDIAYKIYTKGVCPRNSSFSWSFSFYSCDDKEEKTSMKIYIPQGKSGFTSTKLFKAKKIKTMLDDAAIARTITPPTDFTITGKDNSMEGDPVQLYVNYNGSVQGIKWLWFKQGINNSFAEGKSITVSPLFTTQYQLKCELEGFLSAPVNFKINVTLKPEPPKDFSITGQQSILEGDETELSIQSASSIAGVNWHWYRENEKQSFERGNTIIVKPTISTSYRVQGDLNGKKSIFKQVIVNVKKIPEPPSDFSIQGPKSIKEGEEAILKIVAKNKPDEVKWLWYKDGENESFQMGESVKVIPDETTKYYVKATTYKKYSSPVYYTVNVLVRSKAPEVTGKLIICNGIDTKEKYRIKGGKLGTGSQKWQWYEGSCGSGKLIGSGNEIELNLPDKTTTYSVRPDKDNDPTVCSSFTIEVFNSTIMPDKIIVPTDICHDQMFTLRLEGGLLRNNSKWVWYAQPVGSNSRMKVGEGNSITLTALSTTKYIVLSENGICNPPGELTTTVNIITRPVDRSFISSSKIDRKHYRLNAAGVPKTGNFRTVWYENKCTNKPIGNGNNIEIKVNRRGRNIAMRLEGSCDTLGCKDIFLKRDTKEKKHYVFLNAGIVSANGSNIANGMFTIGVKSVYARIKFNLNEVVSLANEQDVQITPQYECTDAGVINYPSNNNTYYQFNNEKEDKRTAYTLGFMFGGKTLRGYLGVGYGKREVIWGMDVFQRNTNSFIDKRSAKNITQSIAGPEAEAGIFLKFSGFNIMLGTSMIYSPTDKKQYFDFNAGIGFSIKTR